jgi:hypothetical protein
MEPNASLQTAENSRLKSFSIDSYPSSKDRGLVSALVPERDSSTAMSMAKSGIRLDGLAARGASNVSNRSE